MLPRNAESGLSRRHFLQHAAGTAVWAGPASMLAGSLMANAPDLRRRHKAALAAHATACFSVTPVPCSGGTPSTQYFLTLPR